MKAARIIFGGSVFISLILALYFLFHVFKLFNLKNKSIHHRCTSIICRWILAACGLRVKVSGRENIKGRINIFAANHSSFFDHLIVYSAIPQYFRISALMMVFNFPVVGYVLKEAGAVRMERTFDKDKMEESLGQAEATLKEASILIYPEGKFSKDGKLLPFRRGMAEIARRSGVPVVPMAIRGSFEILPTPPYKVVGKGIWFFSYFLYWLGFNLLHFNPTEIKVTFGEPQDILPEESVEAFTERVRKKIEGLLAL